MANDVDPIEAELEKLDAEETKPPAGSVRRLLPIILAVITLGGFGAVVWYAYNTGIREGSEFAAPTLKPDGPSKVAPTSPGGQRIADQDKLVYGKIDKSVEGRKVERLLPPPENPLPAPIARKPKTPPLPAPKLEVPKAPPTSGLPATPPKAPAPVQKPKVEVKPEKEAPAVAKIAPSAGTSAVAPPKIKKVPAPPKVASKPPVPKVAAPKTDLSNSYRIQIGSPRSEAAANAAWEKRLKQHGAILGKLSPLVKRADLGKRGVYYRVQAGPLKDRAAATKACDALKKKKVSCLVIRP